jgi:hypothetical protein
MLQHTTVPISGRKQSCQDLLGVISKLTKHHEMYARQIAAWDAIIRERQESTASIHTRSSSWAAKKIQRLHIVVHKYRLLASRQVQNINAIKSGCENALLECLDAASPSSACMQRYEHLMDMSRRADDVHHLLLIQSARVEIAVRKTKY